MKLSKIPEYCKDVPNTRTHVVKNERLFREVSVSGTQFKKMRALSDALDADALIAGTCRKSLMDPQVSACL